MNYPPPTYTPDIKAIGPWFLLSPPTVQVATRLKPGRFERFDYHLDFAGLSAYGIALSVRRSGGPAKIGPYPVLPRVPKGYVPFDAPVISGLLLRTDEPRLAFINVSPQNRYGSFYEALGVHRDDLADIVEIADTRNPKRLANEVAIQELTPQIVNLLIQYPTQLKLVFFKEMLCVRIPDNLCLPKEDWRPFSRHVFTGRAAGCVHDTTRVVEAWGSDLIRLPGYTMPEIADRWGISARRPDGYNGQELLLREFRVDDAAKLARRYPQVRLLEGRVLHVPENTYEFTEFPLQQAAKAGAIPPTGMVLVRSDLEQVLLAKNKVMIDRLKSPLQFRRETVFEVAGLLCPEHLVGNYLLPAAEAARNYQLNAKLTKYRICTLDAVTREERFLRGNYYLLADLTALPRRDIRRERAERIARQKRLIDRYGPDLPETYEQFTDEELEAHFRMEDMRVRGEIIEAKDHPALPKVWYRNSIRFMDWIKEARPEAVMRDPIAERNYVQASLRIEDMAGLPGFWEAVEATLDVSAWLRSLILCPQVRAAALAHVI